MYKGDPYYETFERETLKKISGLLKHRKILLNTLPASEAMVEVVAGNSNNKHRYSAVCKSSFAVVYVLEKNRLLAFPKTVSEILVQTFRLKENNRMEKFRKDILLKIKLSEFMTSNTLKNIQLNIPKCDTETVPKRLQRICSLDKYAKARKTMEIALNTNTNGSMKNDAFLYDIDDKVFNFTDKLSLNTTKMRTQTTFMPMKTLIASSRSNLHHRNQQTLSAFRISKKDIHVMSQKTINFNGLKISFNRAS